MSIKILPGTKETLDAMKGQEFTPEEGEGVVYMKLAFIKPDTIKSGDPAQVIEDAPPVVLCGQLSEIQSQIATWFNESVTKYKDATKPPSPPQERY